MRTRCSPGLVASVLVVSAWSMATYAQNPVSVNIDVQANRHPINPNIYGVAHAGPADLNELNSPLNRNGGNNTTRYNWQVNADNRGNDWYYESIGDNSATPGERGDTFFASSTAAGAQAMLTIPLIDWVAKVGQRPQQACQFLDRQVRRANRKRLAVVPRWRQRHRRQRSVRLRQ